MTIASYCWDNNGIVTIGIISSHNRYCLDNLPSDNHQFSSTCFLPYSAVDINGEYRA